MRPLASLSGRNLRVAFAHDAGSPSRLRVSRVDALRAPAAAPAQKSNAPTVSAEMTCVARARSRRPRARPTAD